MTKIRSFIIPKGVFGLLNVLPSKRIWVYDFYKEQWNTATYVRKDLINVPQVVFTETKFIIKDYIQTLLNPYDYYAILVRSNGYIGLVCAEKEFITKEQQYIMH